MEIRIVDSSTPATYDTLVHGPASASGAYAQGPVGRGVVYSPGISIQEAPALRAAYTRVYNRRNHKATISFGALRSFSSSAAAHAWAAAHTLGVRKDDELWLIDGATTIKLSGVLSGFSPTVQGVSVTVDYTFTYGNVAVTP